MWQHCGKKHHTSICDALKKSEKALTTNQSPEGVFSVVIIKVNDVKCRALIDSGSGSSYISAKLVNMLKAKPVETQTKQVEMLVKWRLRSNKNQKGTTCWQRRRASSRAYQDGVVHHEPRRRIWQEGHAHDSNFAKQLRGAMSNGCLGIEDFPENDQASVHAEFKEQLRRANEGWYQTGLPWRGNHPDLPNNKQGSLQRLGNLTRSLQRKGQTSAYNEVIQEQLKEEIVENAPPEVTGKEFYIPHKAVIRETATTT